MLVFFVLFCFGVKFDKCKFCFHQVKVSVFGSIDFATLYFTVEPKDRCRNVYRMFREGAEFDDKRTNGLYYRELL